MKLLRRSVFSLFFGVLVISCSDDDNNTVNNPEVNQKIEKSAVIENYVNIVLQSYQDSYDTAKVLKDNLDAFVAKPTEETHEAAKKAWLDAREPYGQTEAYRFANGPIDDEATGPEGLLNAWPLDENYVDYVSGNDAAGIINRSAEFPEITKTLLESLNEEGGEKNISVGYHAIEFLLWGQDNTAPSEKKAGLRSFTDFVDDGTTAENEARRRNYLIATADLLLENLQFLIDEWKVGGPYRTEFLALDEDEALTNIMSGIAELSSSELPIERMATALSNRDQEDEHSCFSDNTHRDIILNFDGIKNVYIGKYGDIDGPSIADLVEQVNAEQNRETLNALNTSENNIDAIAIPFDFAISEGAESTEGAKVQKAVTSLQNLGDQLTASATVLGLRLN